MRQRRDRQRRSSRRGLVGAERYDQKRTTATKEGIDGPREAESTRLALGEACEQQNEGDGEDLQQPPQPAIIAASAPPVGYPLRQGAW